MKYAAPTHYQPFETISLDDVKPGMRLEIHMRTGTHAGKEFYASNTNPAFIVRYTAQNATRDRAKNTPPYYWPATPQTMSATALLLSRTMTQ